MTLNESKDFVRWIGKWFLVAYALNLILSATPLMRDSTDNKEWGSARSGMSIHRDKLTGCQYLGVSGGGITPRLLHGKHMGCENA
ncbi:MAG: hypothetical protein HOP06_11950 [Methylotenera sp.]|nr:hypothetical protein [Methylotenera sp.]